MTASREPDAEPQHDAAAIDGAPETPDESARSRELAALFGHPEDPVGIPDDKDAQEAEARSAAARDQLAALFAQPASTQPAAPAPEPLSDSFWETIATRDSPTEEPSRPMEWPGSAVDPDRTDALNTADLTEGARDRPTDDAWEPKAAAAAAFAGPAAAAVNVPEPAVAASSTVEAEQTAVMGATDGAEPSVIDGQTDAAPAGPDDHLDAEAEPQSAAEALAWLGFDDEPELEPAVDPEPETEPEPAAKTAAAAGWLGIVRGDDSATTPPPVVAATAVDEPTAVLPATAADTSAGAFFPAERRGIRGWTPRVRWSVAISIVLLIAVVAGSVLIARSIAANNLAAQELAAAVAELEEAESLAVEPESMLATTVETYDATVELARATADSAAPPLAAVAGMTAQPPLDASNAALAALVAQLDATNLEDAPEPYEREEIDVTDIAEVEAATQTASNHAERVLTAIREVGAAQVALQEKLDALRTAHVALGTSLPETAALIVAENRRALQSFRDAVIAAAAAVGAAQTAGGSGDAELLAYAAAVTALRGDQERVVNDTQPTQPANPAPQPTPTTEPVPPPAPVPEPPAPTPTPDPTEPVTP